MEIKVVRIETPKECNAILGTSHFIKTIEDLYESLVNSVPNIKFGVGFCESSGECLVRVDGTDEELKKAVAKNALNLTCGHSFLIFSSQRLSHKRVERHKKSARSLHCLRGNS